MCTQKSPYNWSEQLYQRHGDVCGGIIVFSASYDVLLAALVDSLFISHISFSTYSLTLIHTTYATHSQTISSYLSNSVVPALRGKHGELLLAEFVKRGANHAIMNKWHQKFFMYLVSCHCFAMLSCE